MKIITDYNITNEVYRGASIAVGNFDGVHLGHQSIIQKAEEFSSKSPLGILTFSPHPREFFDPRKIPFRLMNETSRNNRLKKLGVKILYQISFNKALASLSARDFAKKVLAVGIGAKNVVIGFGITKKTISSLKSADGLVVGSAICEEISKALKNRQNPVTNVTRMVSLLKNRIL